MQTCPIGHDRHGGSTADMIGNERWIGAAVPPPGALIGQAGGLRYVHVLRDPLERVFSHHRYAFAGKWIQANEEAYEQGTCLEKDAGFRYCPAAANGLPPQQPVGSHTPMGGCGHRGWTSTAVPGPTAVDSLSGKHGAWSQPSRSSSDRDPCWGLPSIRRHDAVTETCPGRGVCRCWDRNYYVQQLAGIEECGARPNAAGDDDSGEVRVSKELVHTVVRFDIHPPALESQHCVR